ncbi:MAG TPA: NUDIX hydrolase [Vitreimonas sp.]|nr:NUDIX hydrolase [Vitreimonas sp.]
MTQHAKWKIINQQDVSPSPWFPIVKDEVELPNGKRVEYFRSQLANVAMVIAITKQKEVVFVRQYKHGIGEVCIELPAGRIEVGQTPRAAALHELQQETGVSIAETQLIEVVELWTEPSKSQVRVYGFLVTEVEITDAQNLEETEDIEVIKVPLHELSNFLLTEVHASDTMALLLLAQQKWPELFDDLKAKHLIK